MTALALEQHDSRSTRLNHNTIESGLSELKLLPISPHIHGCSLSLDNVGLTQAHPNSDTVGLFLKVYIIIIILYVTRSRKMGPD